MVIQWSKEVLDYIQQYMNHSVLPYIYLVSLVFLLFRGKEKRRMIVWPSILIMVIILNPVCYGLIWTRLVTYAFWRMLWMIPMIPVIGCAVLEISALLKKQWVAPVCATVFIVCMFVFGDNIYQQPGVFTKAQNMYKLPQQTVDVGEKLLELEDEPMVVAPSNLYCYLRQYSGKIHMVYGRDAEAYISPIEDADTQQLLALMQTNAGDAQSLTALARAKAVNLIVLPDNHQFEGMEANGFEKVAEVDGMWIYQDEW